VSGQQEFPQNNASLAKAKGVLKEGHFVLQM
jgi:hypothetical protein